MENFEISDSFTRDDYLYINLNKKIIVKIFDKRSDDIGNYIITDVPIIEHNYRKYPIRYTTKLKSTNYEDIKYLPRLDISFYIKNDYGYIGGGLYGRVYKSGNYAIKTFVNTFPYQSHYLDSSYLRETAALLRLKHPNIIDLIDIIEGTPSNSLDKTSLSIIMPLADMNLDKYIKENNKTQEYFLGKGFIAYELIKGFNYLHNQDIIHSDIKLDNILLFKSNNILGYDIKISDFGISTHTSCQPSKLMNDAYTTYYRPPEVILKLGFGLSADIWALANVLYTLYTEKYLFFHPNDNIESDNINNLPDGPAKTKLYNDYQKELANRVLERVIKILGNPLNDWPELIQLIDDKYDKLYNKGIYNEIEIKDIKDNYLRLFKSGEYHPQIIRATIKDDDMYSIIMKMLKFNPDHRIKLSEVLSNQYFKKLTNYDINIEQVICDDVIDKRQKYPSTMPIINYDFISIRIKSFEYILERIQKYKFDNSDFFMIYYIFDTCYNSSITIYDYINFTIACISIWSTFKYGEPRGIPTKNLYDKISDDQLEALSKISKYSRMIVNILGNDLTVTTVVDYKSENNSVNFMDLLENTMRTDAPFKYLAKDIYKSMDIYYYYNKYVKIINDIRNQL